ncbi:5741_t:CDS:2 [Acaulospora colombiana]|uniref:5741_t:CDS:1 n=1 Tax=Acaulospora colombiana TaxID=27376 RepID=A0ACA9LW59_9GLOM|nr:5741_t:CDS:2 [Acaulospora colombiana]
MWCPRHLTAEGALHCRLVAYGIDLLFAIAIVSNLDEQSEWGWNVERRRFIDQPATQEEDFGDIPDVLVKCDNREMRVVCLECAAGTGRL